MTPEQAAILVDNFVESVLLYERWHDKPSYQDEYHKMKLRVIEALTTASPATDWVEQEDARRIGVEALKSSGLGAFLNDGTQIKPRAVLHPFYDQIEETSALPSQDRHPAADVDK